MNPLGTYCALGMDGLLNFLGKHSNIHTNTADSPRSNPIEYILEPQERTSYPINPFTRTSKNVTIKDQQILHLCRAEQKGDLISQFFEDRDRFIAEVYLERGTMNAVGDSPFSTKFEHMTLEFPSEVSLPSERTIPGCRIQIQTEFQKLSDINLKRKDCARACWLFWRNIDLEKTLPTALFLKIPEMRYIRMPAK